MPFATAVNWIKQYQKIYFLQSFICGFHFYDGPKHLHVLKQGQLLQLKREPENKHDEFAIAVYLNSIKLGYLPAESNEILAKLIDTQLLEPMAELTHLQTQAQPWENAAIAVYALKEKQFMQQDVALPHTTLYTPEYATIKLKNGEVTRLYYDDFDVNEYQTYPK